MNHKNYVNETILLKTITPIFIGDDQGSDLSPFSDFVVEGNSLKLINKKKFEKLLTKDNDLVDNYVDQIKNNSARFDLKEFITNKLNAEINQLISGELHIEGFLANNNVKRFISSAGRPFIPGSTIKGAVRTAVIYNFLINSEVGKKKVSNLLNESVAKYKELENLRKNKKERGLTKDEENTFRNLSKRRNIESDLRKYYDELTLFKDSRNGHDFRHLQISDSPLIEPGFTRVANISVEYLIKAGSKTSPWKQVLNNNTTTTFSMKIVKEFSDDFLKPFNSLTYQGLFSILNKFSKDVIEFELERFDEFINNGKADKSEIEQKLAGIRIFYKDLLRKIESSEDKFAIMRIGGGKTYFDNSIGLALYKYDKEKFKQFRKLLGFWKHRNKSFVEEDSPITRSFIFNNEFNEDIPLGWIAISLKDQESVVEKLFTKTNKPIVKKETSISASDEKSSLDYSKLSNLGRIIDSKNNKKD